MHRMTCLASLILLLAGCGDDVGDAASTAPEDLRPSDVATPTGPTNDLEAETETETIAFKVTSSNDVALNYTIRMLPQLPANDPALYANWSSLTDRAPDTIDCLDNGTTEAVFVGTLTVEYDSDFEPDDYIANLRADGIEGDSPANQFGVVVDGSSYCSPLTRTGSPINVGGEGEYPFFVAVGDVYGPGGTDVGKLQALSSLQAQGYPQITAGAGTTAREEYFGTPEVEFALPDLSSDPDAAATGGPTDLPSSSETPDTSAYEDFTGTWRGDLTYQPDSGVSIPVELELAGEVGQLAGVARYGDCETQLSGSRIDGPDVLLDESPLRGCDPALSEDTEVRLTLDGDVLDMEVTFPGEDDVLSTASLARG